MIVEGVRGVQYYTLYDRASLMIDVLDRKYHEYTFSIIVIWPMFALIMAVLMRTYALPEPYTMDNSRLQDSLNTPQSVLAFFFISILIVPTTLEFLTILNVIRERGPSLYTQQTTASRTLLSLLCFCAAMIIINLSACINILRWADFVTWEANVDKDSVSFVRHLTVISVWTVLGLYRLILSITVPSVYNGAFVGTVCILGPLTTLLMASSEVGCFESEGFDIFIMTTRLMMLAVVLYKDLLCIYTVYIWPSSLLDACSSRERSTSRSSDAEKMGRLADDSKVDPLSEPKRQENEDGPAPLPSPGGVGNFNLQSLNTAAPSDTLFGFTPGLMSSNGGGVSAGEGGDDVEGGDDYAVDDSDDDGGGEPIGSDDGSSVDLEAHKLLDKSSSGNGDRTKINDRDTGDGNDSSDSDLDDSEDDQVNTPGSSKQSTESQDKDKLRENPEMKVGVFIAFNSTAIGFILISMYRNGVNEDSHVGDVIGMACLMSYVMLFVIRVTSFFLLDESFEFLIDNQEEQSSLQMKRELLRRFLPDDVIRSVQKKNSSTTLGSFGPARGGLSNTATAPAAGGSTGEKDGGGAYAKHPDDLVVSFLDISLIDTVTYSIIGECIAHCTPHVTADSVTFRFNLSEVLKRMDSHEGAYLM